jgi:hypothetical protein
MKKSELRQIIKEEIYKIIEKNISESQELNPINKFFHELASEGEKLVKKMKEINENL